MIHPTLRENWFIAISRKEHEIIFTLNVCPLGRPMNKMRNYEKLISERAEKLLDKTR